MPTIVTITELHELLEPFVGAKLVPFRGYREGEAINLPAVDIATRSTLSLDADIRALDQDGIERFFWSGAERIAWADVDYITIRHGADATTYVPSLTERRAAA